MSRRKRFECNPQCGVVDAEKESLAKTLTPSEYWQALLARLAEDQGVAPVAPPSREVAVVHDARFGPND
jgi:hypothetical protein